MTCKRVLRSGSALLLLTATLSACIDEVTQPERIGVAAQTNAIRLVLDDTPVLTIYEDGKQSLGPIVFIRTATNVTTDRAIRVELLDRSGSVIPNVSPNDVRINIGTNSNNTASFIRTDAFTGILRSSVTTLPATTDLIVGLYDMTQRRVAIGPYSVRITARLP